MVGQIRKILIVEDDFRLAGEWQEELIEKGYTADAVTTAEEASFLLKNNYDCFVLDLYHIRNKTFLPDGGIKAIGNIRRYEMDTNKRSMIIAVTGFYRSEKDNVLSTDHVIKNLGADFVLKKPFDLPDLLKIIEKN